MAARGETTGETNYRKSLTTGSQGICINSGKQANDEGFELQNSLNFLSDIFLCEENIFIYFFLFIIICRMEMIPDEYFLIQRWKYILRIIFDSKVHEEKIIYQILIYIKTFFKIEDTCISVGRKIEQLVPLILGNKYMY